jgi:hypothetical protein
VGRLSVIALFLNWFRHLSRPFSSHLLGPETITCSAIAWLCLIADWGFLRILCGKFLRPNDPLYSPPKMARVEAAPEQGNKARRKSIMTEDIGDWFKARFPKLYKVMSWIILPLAYVAVSSLADNGNIQAIPAAILRYIVIAPAFIQIFWTPVADLNKLISAVSDKTAQPEFRYT